MADQREPLYPDVPTLKESVNLDWKIGVWRGIAGPKGLPDEVVKRMEQALDRVNHGQEYRDFIEAARFWRRLCKRRGIRGLHDEVHGRFRRGDFGHRHVPPRAQLIRSVAAVRAWAARRPGHPSLRERP